jgi:hypothetical protein
MQILFRIINWFSGNYSWKPLAHELQKCLKSDLSHRGIISRRIIEKHEKGNVLQIPGTTIAGRG